MGATRTFRLIPPACAIEGMPQSGTQRWPKRLAPRVQRVKNVIDKADSQPAGGEWELVQSAITGDAEALATLFARERTRLYRTALSVLRNKEDAEDALQNGLLSAYVNLRSFEGRSRFSTWLTRIVLNAALMNRRKLRVLSQMSFDEIVVNDPQPRTTQLVDPHPSPEQICALAETRDVVEQKMSQLSPLLRSALRLRDVEDLSTREAANAASVKISAIKSRTTRARHQLASLLAAEGVNASRANF